VAAQVIRMGDAAHADERAALQFLVDGLPPTAWVFTNPWMYEPSGATYELDAIVVMPHGIYVVEIKGWRGHLTGGTRDWYLPEPRRSPLLLSHKTAQILHSQLASRSYEAGRVWVQELVFLPAAASFQAEADAVRKRVVLRGDLHATLHDVGRMRELANRRPAEAVTDEVIDTLTKLLYAAPRRPALTEIAGFRVIDRLDATERYREVLAEDITRTRRILRIYTLPWNAGEAEAEQLRKRATWEAGILRSFSRAPQDVGLLVVDPPVETELGLVVPMEHFDGQSLPAWLDQHGAKLPLSDRVQLWARIARTLAWTHASGVVHRQLRPDLVLVRGEVDPRNPLTPEFRVTGFEMAKRQGHGSTIAWSDSMIGRMEGAAPEVVQLISDAVPASDQFSLGLLLALLVLRAPLVESTLLLVERRHRMPHLRDRDPNLPQRLDDAVARMLERKPTDRFPSVEAAITHVLDAVNPAQPAPAAAALTPGARVGNHYVIETRLGEGGLAEVYKAKHQLLGERVALKVARPTDVAERALQCEYHALQAVQHPAVVRARDLTRLAEDRIALILDLVPGVTLSELVRQGTLPPDDVAARRRLGEDLLAALDEFERIELVHNDLKPDNLMVRPDGRLVIIDFSLARGPAVEAKMGPNTTIGGTWDWRDPSGEPPGHPTDRYAAAMCLFWLHAGRHPFNGRVPEPDEAPEFDATEVEPAALHAFFRAALHPVPADRFRNARAMREAWLAALGAPLSEGADEHGALTADLPLSETQLPPRAVRALASAQVRTLGELLHLSDDATPGADRLSRVPGLGDRTLTRIHALLHAARRQGVQPADRHEPDAPPLFRPLAHDPTPLSHLPTDPALLDALGLAGLRTIGDVASRTRAELRRLPRVNDAAMQRLAAALVTWHQRQSGKASADTLDGLWSRAVASLDDLQRDVLELSFGLHEEPLTQAAIGARLGLDQPTVSVRKHAALDRLDRAVLAPIAGALDGYLDLERGILPLPLACERLARDLPTATIEPAGLIRLLATLDTTALHLLDGPAGGAVLARPWFDRNLLALFTDTVARVVAGWPPESIHAARQTLRMVLPDFEGDPILLAQRLLPDVRTTASGALFQPPVDVRQGLHHTLGTAREDLTHDELRHLLDHEFQGLGPHLPPLHELPALLEGTAWKVEGARIVRAAAAATPTRATPGDSAHDLLSIDATLDPLEQVRSMLQGAATRGGGFRLVVAPPDRHRLIARSLIAALGAHGVDLTDAWFTRHESSLAADARAARFAALRVATSKRLDTLLTDLVDEHGAPNRTVVLHETALLEALGGLDQIRLLYDRLRGQSHGFWVMVIPGLIHRRQPLFNERTPVWHQPGLVLPLSEPLPPAPTPRAAP
jgi:serine/threonine protein kinase